MELFCALLTAVLLWLFLLRLIVSARARARQKAGALLLEWRCYERPYSRVHFIIADAIMISLVLAMIVLLIIHVDPLGIPWLRFICLLFIACGGVCPWLASRLTEIRENGIVQFAGACPVVFLPWPSIEHCTWSTSHDELCVQLRRRVRNLLVPADQAESVTSLLCRFVEVRDSEGRVINADLQKSPNSMVPDEAAVPEFRRFQFSLGTMLLFMLVASSACSWFGIHYRRGQREAAALAELDEFHPEVTRFPIGGLRLDFSASQPKPGDEEMAILAQLPRLHRLDLTGSPVTDDGLRHIGRIAGLENLYLRNCAHITDAGLIHLEHLTTLESVWLHGTQVTDDGVQRLRKALPKTEIKR
jgi:hypothetical protein